jgi:hypothetical protein
MHEIELLVQAMAVMAMIFALVFRKAILDAVDRSKVAKVAFVVVVLGSLILLPFVIYWAFASEV